MATPERMREAFLSELAGLMKSDADLFLLSADFGSPVIDGIRKDFPARFLNVGIAEQNLINVAAGLSLEGYKVVAYAIAPFLCMRCFEQIRVNLAMLSQFRPLHVTLLGVGAGTSYDMAGPSHQALEDISLMLTLPHMEVFSPSDAATTQAVARHTLTEQGLRYVRLDGKPLPNLFAPEPLDWAQGWRLLRGGTDVMLISTGYMTHKALVACDLLAQRGVDAGVVDLFRLDQFDEETLMGMLQNVRCVVSIEEAFSGAGGLDSRIFSLARRRGLRARVEGLGIPRRYPFMVGSRDALLADLALDEASIASRVETLLRS